MKPTPISPSLVEMFLHCTQWLLLSWSDVLENGGLTLAVVYGQSLKNAEKSRDEQRP